jgi:hypothetical protein
MKQFTYFLCALIAVSCGNSSTENERKTNTPKISQVQNKSEKTDSVEDVAPWADSLIMLYIKKHNFKMTKTDSFPLTYIKEEADWNDENYIATRIGQSFENHFATSQWIYIKESDKAIFEYDAVHDSLILWNFK